MTSWPTLCSRPMFPRSRCAQLAAVVVVVGAGGAGSAEVVGLAGAVVGEAAVVFVPSAGPGSVEQADSVPSAPRVTTIEVATAARKDTIRRYPRAVCSP